MSEDKRDVLEVLRYELNFLEQGGYGNWYSTPWGPASIFQDSLTCPNHGDPTRPHACHECLLYDFVPEKYRTEDVPCHHIPLNRQGYHRGHCEPDGGRITGKRQALAEADNREYRSGSQQAESLSRRRF
jgi:hypothetical protein